MSGNITSNGKALFELERRYESLIENLPDGIFTLTPQGSFIGINQEFSASLGYTRNEILNTPFIGIVYRDDVDRFDKCLKLVVEQGQVIRGFECRLVAKGGQVKYFEINASGVYGLDGELISVEGIAHDISERKRAEERIRNLKELNETIINSIRAGLVVIDARTQQIITVNRSYLRQRNLTEAQVLGQAYGGIERYDGMFCEGELIEQVLRTGKVTVVEHIHRLADRGDRTIELTAHPIRNRDNEIVQIMILDRDVTERRQMEEELRKRVAELSFLKEISEALQGTLKLEEILYIILVGATAGQGLGFNRAFLWLYNGQEDVLEGRMALGPSNPEQAWRIWSDLDRKQLSLAELLRSYDPRIIERDSAVNQIIARLRISMAQTDNILVRALNDRKPFNVKDGLVIGHPSLQVGEDLMSSLGVRSFAVVPLYSRGKRIGVLVADNAITGRTITDEEISSLWILAHHASSAIENSRLYHELEEKVRDLESANELIQRTQAELLEAERLSTIGRMAAILAHEIRNPLVSIGGFARSLLKGFHQEDARREELEIIVSEVMRLEQLVKDVLEYARFAKPKPQPVNINVLIRQVLDLVRYELRSNNIRLRLELEEDLPEIAADQNQMRQVFINLVFNSIHAMPDGGELHISSGADGRYAEIKVADTGCGIPPENLDKVFSPFFTTKTMGGGLGLHVVSQIITDHGGSISVQSKEGKGTIFTIYLPLVVGEANHENDTGG